MSDVIVAKDRTYYTYKCQYCGHECVKKPGLASGLNVTKLGDYGSNATPTPVAYIDEMYEATTISFTAETASEPAYISDSAVLFGDKHFYSGMSLEVETTDGTNDTNGTPYTIADKGVTRGVLTLSSSDSLTTQSAATAGTVTLSRSIYEPSVSTGCAFCGSLNSKL
jgi:hypothetical protein